MVHGYSIHTDIHLYIFNKWMIGHGYSMDTSTWEQDMNRLKKQDYLRYL